MKILFAESKTLPYLCITIIKQDTLMKKIFYIAMVIVIFAVTLFNVCFAYSNIDCMGCATMLFLSMELVSAVLVAWGFRNLYKMYEEGKLDLFNTNKE